MPRFYFHLHHGGKVTLDNRGVDLPNAKAALHEGERQAREMIERGPGRGKSLENQHIKVVDDLGTFLFRLPLPQNSKGVSVGFCEDVGWLRGKVTFHHSLHPRSNTTVSKG